jgi:hypothetical protein
MSSKKVTFGTKPDLNSLDALVQSRSEGQGAAPVASVPAPEKEKEATRRVSVDLPLSLHTQLKLHCVQSGVLMADYVRDLIAREFKTE